jgi:hypothetical protein
MSTAASIISTLNTIISTLNTIISTLNTIISTLNTIISATMLRNTLYGSRYDSGPLRCARCAARPLRVVITVTTKPSIPLWQVHPRLHADHAGTSKRSTD